MVFLLFFVVVAVVLGGAGKHWSPCNDRLLIEWMEPCAALRPRGMRYREVSEGAPPSRGARSPDARTPGRPTAVRPTPVSPTPVDPYARRPTPVCPYARTPDARITTTMASNTTTNEKQTSATSRHRPYLDTSCRRTPFSSPPSSTGGRTRSMGRTVSAHGGARRGGSPRSPHSCGLGSGGAGARRRRRRPRRGSSRR